MTRAQFERFLAGPPYNRTMTLGRYTDGPTWKTWRGRYLFDDVQLAWEVLQEAERLEREHQRKLIRLMGEDDR